MILNIFGPSGSGKTTLVKELLRNDKILTFFDNFSKEQYEKKISNKLSVSLIPLPKFRGTVKEFFNIFSIDINILLSLEEELNKLSESIFSKINDNNTLEKISLREIATFSAGELRRLFILKSLLVNSQLLIIDEPFSNSDRKLWDIIYKAINKKRRVIVLSHLSLQNLFGLDKNNISIDINDVSKKFIIEK